MANLQIADLQTVVEVYYNSTVLGTKQIKQIFKCSDSTANRKKREAQLEQEKAGIKPYSRSTVNTRIAYRVWGLDIKDLERRLEQYHKLKEKGVFSQERLSEGLNAHNRSALAQFTQTTQIQP